MQITNHLLHDVVNAVYGALEPYSGVHQRWLHMCTAKVLGVWQQSSVPHSTFTATSHQYLTTKSGMTPHHTELVCGHVRPDPDMIES